MIKKCLNCKTNFEVKYNIERRKYCCRSCKSSHENTMEKHPQWKGDKVSYNTLHRWVQRRLGKPQKCCDCGMEGRRVNGRWNIWWSNKSGQYKRDLNDWEGRCRVCHYKYDENTEKRAYHTKKGMVLKNAQE
jgi:hypothetical protein